MLKAVVKPWLKRYPPEVSPEIDATPYSSVVELLDESFRNFANRDAAVCMDTRVTFLDQMSQALGAWLQGQGSGARVALMMPNLPQYLVVLSAVLRAGFVVVNVNPLYTRELEHQLIDSGAEAIVLLENFAHTLEEVIAKTRLRHVVLDSTGVMFGFWKGLLINFAVRHVRKVVPAFELSLDGGCSVTRFDMAIANGMRMSLHRVNLRPDDVAFLQYTGRTTCVSKGATLLNRNVAANILQAEEWVQADARANRRQASRCRLRPAAVSHLRADGLLPVRRATRNEEYSYPKSARHSQCNQDASAASHSHVSRREHPIQRAGVNGGQEPRLFGGEDAVLRLPVFQAMVL